MKYTNILAEEPTNGEEIMKHKRKEYIIHNSADEFFHLIFPEFNSNSIFHPREIVLNPKVFELIYNANLDKVYGTAFNALKIYKTICMYKNSSATEWVCIKIPKLLEQLKWYDRTLIFKGLDYLYAIGLIHMEYIRGSKLWYIKLNKSFEGNHEKEAV